eukprot:CAMPEP_0185857820 /NCGR_PEP_ID=MMETSP1354-20130828/29696_1 /TAXON_ID=708628 /ORGANISM="Erythrolobus madagascarensis, Strain CCMP3276" /LENGTH=222 /DNA_ID=CAMNT_0028560091 /DNA_START=257 /DNA_END=925 /DNA_ORIENTATION=+
MEAGLLTVRALGAYTGPILRLVLNKLSVLAPLSILGLSQLSDEISTEVAIYASLALCWGVLLPVLYANRAQLFENPSQNERGTLREEWLKNAWDASRDTIIDMDKVHDVELSAADLYYGPEKSKAVLDESTTSTKSYNYELFGQDSDPDDDIEQAKSKIKADKSKKNGSTRSGAPRKGSADAARSKSGKHSAPKTNRCVPKTISFKPQTIVGEFRALGLELL